MEDKRRQVNLNYRHQENIFQLWRSLRFGSAIGRVVRKEPIRFRGVSQNDVIIFKKTIFICYFHYRHISTHWMYSIRGCYPGKPININMNVKIEHEINVKIDRQVEDLLKTIVLYSTLE